MKKVVYLITVFSLISCFGISQKIEDLFTKSETKITWLGIDFSHVKLIGEFSQFAEAGATGAAVIKDKYFSGWNNLILNEYEKYNIEGMIRKENINLNISGIEKINNKTAIEDLESDDQPNYLKEDIALFIKKYNFEEKAGIGLLMVADYLNKTREEAKYHFVAINLTNNEVLLYESFVTKPGGFGLRNYWAKTFYDVIISIRDVKYKYWKKTYGPK